MSGLSDHDAIKLLERIEAFELDDPKAQFPFSSRLAGEQGWSHVFAAKVIREYRRFVGLAMVAGHPVSPSAAVDQVWHLHLVYTKNYWREMCGECLGQELHHSPTTGGGEEGAKFHDWYGRTLDSYRRFFGMEPPEDVWPSPERRLEEPEEGRWIVKTRFWLIPRPVWTRRGWWERRWRRKI